MPIEPVPHDPELTSIESALAALRPSRVAVDRDRVMFLAGVASVTARRPTSRGGVWMAAAAVLALVASAEGVLLATRRAGPTIAVRMAVPPEPPSGRIIVAQAPAPLPHTAPAVYPPAFGRTDHDRLVAQVVRYGLDGLPAPSATWAESSPGPLPSRQRLLEELNTPLAPGDPS